MTRSEKRELRLRKIDAYRKVILGLISRVSVSGADYSEELERLKKKNPVDLGLILIAEGQAFEEEMGK